MKKGAQTRGRMIESMARHLTSQGYFGTGLNQIIDETKAPKGSLYFHFPNGKEQLAAEAIVHAAAEWRAEILAKIEGVDDPIAAIGLFFDFLEARLINSKFASGCPVATVALEAADSSDLLHQVCSQAYGFWTEVLERALAGWMIPPDLVKPVATTVLAVIEGAIVLAKAERSTRPIGEVRKVLEIMLVGLKAQATIP